MAQVDTVAEARRAAQAAADLRVAAGIGGLSACDLRRGARNLVFAGGLAEGAVMVVGEAPGRDEDQEGAAFRGAAVSLFYRMLGAKRAGAGMRQSRSGRVITNVLPWPPAAEPRSCR